MRRARARWAATAVLGTLAAACAPVVSSAPPAATEAPPPACATVPAPTPSPDAPQEYVAAVDPTGGNDFAVETFTAASIPECDASVAELDAGGAVLALEPLTILEALDVDPADDTSYAQLYGLAVSDFATAWNAGYEGTGVEIAVVDSGVQGNHPDLDFYDRHHHIDPKVEYAKGVDYVAGGNGTDDQNSHGTHVAGIAAAADNQEGVVGGAPGASIMPVRVLNASGSGSNANVANGINWARTHGADVVNLSLGGSTNDGVVAQAIQLATNAGVVVVAAAGNCGAGGSTCPGGVNSVSYPGALPTVIAVGASDSNNFKASYSNSNSYVDVVAPGTNILSTVPFSTYAPKSGTSMATPHVAAVAALLKQKCPAITTAQTISRLQSTGFAAPSGFLAPAKRINVGAALAAPC